MGGQQNRHAAKSHAKDGGDQRKSRSHHRPKSEDQHDKGNAHADGFTGGLNIQGVTKRRSAGFHGQTLLAAHIHSGTDRGALFVRHVRRRGHIQAECGVADAFIGAEQGEVRGVDMRDILWQPHGGGLIDHHFFQLGAERYWIAVTSSVNNAVQVRVQGGDHLINRLGVLLLRQGMAFRGGKHHGHARCFDGVAYVWEVLL